MESPNTGRRSALLPLAALALALAAAWLWGCGTDSYSPPHVDNAWTRHPQVLTATDNALVDNVVLKGWVDNGLVNADADERVVLLEVGTSAASWDNLHVPGALFLNQSLLVATRFDGVDGSLNEPAPGAQMDNLVRSLGIDERTTVVFTFPAGTTYYWATRGYYTFRYWGFPKERLKLLNGGNGAYLRAHGAAAMEGLLGGATAFPAATWSSFSVRENLVLRDDLRASAGEFLRAVADNAPGVAVVDTRNSYPQFTGARGATTSPLRPVFEGRVRGARWLPVTDVTGTAEGTFTGLAGSDNVIRTGQSLLDLLALRGLDGTQRTYTYCTSGVIGTSAFFVLDGMLGWDAVLYDGSFAQWGNYSDQASRRGRLPAGSPWATDALTVSGRFDNTNLAGPTYLDNASAYSFSPVNPWLPLSDPAANPVEAEDRLYMTPPAAPPGGGSSGGAGSAGGGC